MHRPMLVARCLDSRTSPLAAQQLWCWLSCPVLHGANWREGRFRLARTHALPASSREHRGDYVARARKAPRPAEWLTGSRGILRYASRCDIRQLPVMKRTWHGAGNGNVWHTSCYLVRACSLVDGSHADERQLELSAFRAATFQAMSGALFRGWPVRGSLFRGWGGWVTVSNGIAWVSLAALESARLRARALAVARCTICLGQGPERRPCGRRPSGGLQRWRGERPARCQGALRGRSRGRSGAL